MAGLKELITPNYLATYWEQNPYLVEPYFGESKFPNSKQIGISLDYIKGANKAPVRLSASNFDADVIKLKRQGFETLSMEMPYFKNAYSIDEQTRQKLLLIQSSGNASMRDVILNRVFNDEAKLIANARLTAETLRMEALTTGAIVIDDNGVSKAYDYGVPADHKITLQTTSKWDAPDTADPIKDLNDWKLMLSRKGVNATELLMNSETLNLLTKVQSIKDKVALYAITNSSATLTQAIVKQVILAETGFTVYVYDKGYEIDGEFTKFVPDNVVVVMPSTILGNTYFGTTPAEADLMDGSNAVDRVAIVETGVALYNDTNVDPVWKRIIAAMVCLPSFELADSIVISTVA